MKAYGSRLGQVDTMRARLKIDVPEELKQEVRICVHWMSCPYVKCYHKTHHYSNCYCDGSETGEDRECDYLEGDLKPDCIVLHKYSDEDD